MLDIVQQEGVEAKLTSIPEEAKAIVQHLRSLIIDVASENPRITRLEESLKWGELSYAVKKGSPIRIGWKVDQQQLGLYFICTTSLVETFRYLYTDQLRFEKNRAIIFPFDTDMPEAIVRDCITLAMDYHLLKDQEFLGR